MEKPVKVGGFEVVVEQTVWGFGGQVWKDGEKVGYVQDGGAGAAVTIFPPAVERAFEALVDEEARKQGRDPRQALGYERAVHVVRYADLKRNTKGCEGLTLAQHVGIVARERTGY